jgi:hypothetical protein
MDNASGKHRQCPRLVFCILGLGNRQRASAGAISPARRQEHERVYREAPESGERPCRRVLATALEPGCGAG